MRNWIFAGLLLVIFFVTLVFIVLNKSVTFDEPDHILSGYVYPNVILDQDHPPLVKFIVSLPLRFLNPHINGDPSEFVDTDVNEYGKDFLFHSGNDAEKIIFVTRFTMIVLAVIFGFLVYSYSCKLYGFWAGLFSLFLFCFCPVILAYSGFVILDVAVSMFILLSVFTFYRFCMKPTIWNLIIVSIVFGLAQVSKFSAILLIPIFLVLIILLSLDKKFVFKKHADFLGKFLKMTSAFIFVLAIGYFIIWTIYKFDIGKVNIFVATQHGAMSDVLDSKNVFVSVADSFTKHISVLAPKYFEGVIAVSSYGVRGWKNYFLGQYFQSGPWYYFPIMFLIKTPIVLLGIFFYSVAFFIKRKNRFLEFKYRETLFLIVPILVFFVAAIFYRQPFGIRYILPVYPFIFVLAGNFVNLKFKKRIILFVILIVWYVFSSISVFPNYLLYYNEFVKGGSSSSYKYNLHGDHWGQDVRQLAEYLKNRNIREVYYRNYGSADLSYYGIECKPLTDEPVKGIIAIHVMELFLPNFGWDRNDYFDWLKKYKPIKNIGCTIWVYEIK